jgi:hypothetical protein
MNQTQKAVAVGLLFVGSLSALVYVWLAPSKTDAAKMAPLRPGLIRATDLERTTPGRPPSPSPVVVEGTLVRMARATLAPVTPPAVPDAPRNIFEYLPPPPPKPVPPPPPPPITLQSVYPPSVYARSTMTYELIVQAQPLPEGARVVIDGNALVAERKADHQLQVRLTPDLTAQPRNAAVRIVVPGQEGKWYSNDLTLTIEAPPNPNDEYRYIGMVTDAGGQNPRAVLATATEYQTVRPNDPIGRFRVKAITREQVVVEDTQLPGVSHTIPLSSGPPPTRSATAPPIGGGYPQISSPSSYQAPQKYQVPYGGQPPVEYDGTGQPAQAQLEQLQPSLPVKPITKPQQGQGGIPVTIGNSNTVKPTDGSEPAVRPFSRRRPPAQQP